MKLLVSALGVFVLLCALVGAGFVWMGQRAPVNVSIEHALDIHAERQVVWAALTNIATLTQRYDDIEEVELLESDELGALRWKVRRGDTSVFIYRRTMAQPFDALNIAIDGGNMGITGDTQYRLTALDDARTRLEAVENTAIEDFVLRAAFVLAGGRDKVLKAQLAEIKAVSEAQ